ncbi:alpha/beta fold hydrolase [Microbacterium lacticum]|uniref:alpha/beta fold hydrolase n=1 Tax=Microbacterium lacticum TaxID=33885 RepID=UPI001F577C45|nr:alpha/beta fold hydrolase [Microbacterium lacticum]
MDVRGHGPRVAVLLHGLTGSSESWSRVAPLLAERGYRVLSLDLPGHGLSPRDAELTIRSAADRPARRRRRIDRDCVMAFTDGLMRSCGRSAGGN